MGSQLSYDTQQVRKLAAKASAGHLARLHSVACGQIGVHEFASLVVQDDGAANAAMFQLLSRCEDQRCLARAKKTADNRHPWLGVQVFGGHAFNSIWSV